VLGAISLVAMTRRGEMPPSYSPMMLAGSNFIFCLFNPFLGLLKAGLDLPECTLAYSASVGDPGEAFFHLVKLCFCQIFKCQELVAGICTDADQLV
jgi:hypothetical protein